MTGRVMVGAGARPHYVEIKTVDGAERTVNLDSFSGHIGPEFHVTGAAVPHVFSPENMALLRAPAPKVVQAPAVRQSAPATAEVDGKKFVLVGKKWAPVAPPAPAVAPSVPAQVSTVTGTLTVQVKGMTITGLTLEQVMALMGPAQAIVQAPAVVQAPRHAPAPVKTISKALAMEALSALLGR
jgi:hypothetical protein